MAKWVPDPAVPTAPAPILDSVVSVPCGDDPGTVVASGPADATASGQAERQDVELEAARQARYISAFEEQVRDLNGQEDDGTLEVVALINQLEALEKAAEKSVAAELETMIEGDNCSLRDTVGRERILEMCKEIRRGCQRLDTSTMLAKLQHGFTEATAGGSSQASAEERPGDGSMPLLQVPRGRKPLSLWDWKVWPLAKPHLWRYGDASNLYYDEDLGQGRRTYLTSQEWITCLLTREEMEYDLFPGEGFSAAWPGEGFEINRFAEDWPSPTGPLLNTHTHAPKRSHRRAQVHRHPTHSFGFPENARAHPHAHTHTHAHPHARTHARTRGLADAASFPDFVHAL